MTRGLMGQVGQCQTCGTNEDGLGNVRRLGMLSSLISPIPRKPLSRAIWRRRQQRKQARLGNGAAGRGGGLFWPGRVLPFP